MPTTTRRTHADDLRAASRLVVDATTGVSSVVEQMHRTIASGPAVLGSPLRTPVNALTGLIYGSIRGVTRAVGRSLDRALAQLAPLLGESEPGPQRLAVISALNGVLGDFLAGSGNALALPMQLCRRGRPLELSRGGLFKVIKRPSRRLLVMAHGSSTNDLGWLRFGHDHGASLESELGFTTVALRYNTGLHVSVNGEGLAAVLEQLVAAWPVKVDQLVLLAHSMGGLVARSACHAAQTHRHRWRRQLTALVCLGTPHHGAPLERGGNWVDTLLGVSRYSAPLAKLGQIRSAGVTDLRFGNVLESDWKGRDRFRPGRDPRSPLPLPKGVRCFAVAATLSKGPGARLRSDGLVPVDSALGRSSRKAMTLAFPASHRQVVYRHGHLDLLSSPEVYRVIADWLR